MTIAIQNNLIKFCHNTKRAPQLWGIVTFGRQTQDMKKSLAAKLQGRSDIEWDAGSNWCLVCEQQNGYDLPLASSRQSILHVAVAGKVWSLDNKSKEDAQLVAELYKLHGDGLINLTGNFALSSLMKKTIEPS